MADVRPGANTRSGLNRPAAVAVEAAGYAAGLVLAGMAAVRRGKAVHPHGIVFDAELVVGPVAAGLEGAELFAKPGRRPAIVRFSRSVGVPRPLPDLLGMSVRVPDAYGGGRHQDFLLVTSVNAPIAHHLFAPARDAQQRPYSSSLPYRVGDRTLLVGALPRWESPRPQDGNELERLIAGGGDRSARVRPSGGHPMGTVPAGGRAARGNIASGTSGRASLQPVENRRRATAGGNPEPAARLCLSPVPAGLGPDGKAGEQAAAEVAVRRRLRA